MHTFQFPYYGLCIPDVQLVSHADLAVQTALELKHCVASLRTPAGEPLDVRIGLASGASCAGLIGSAGITFVVTGDPRVLAQGLADTTHDIAISAATDALLQVRRRASCRLLFVQPLLRGRWDAGLAIA